MTETTFDIAIIGAGIVGLATAMELVARRKDLAIAVFDKETCVAAHQTGNNSGVIHAGLYYKPGSLKAKMAVEGARLMIEFCQQHNLPYELCGKVVVATDQDEVPRLEELYRRGTENRVPGLRRIGPDEIREFEPHAIGVAGLWSPNTGIADYRAVSEAYARFVSDGGGQVLLDTQITGIEKLADGLDLSAPGRRFRTRGLINCGGLQSDRIAKMAGAQQVPRIVPFRGEYLGLADDSQRLVRGLIYPVPDPRFPFLGVHFTKKVGGGVEAGPNAVLAFAREGYRKTDFSLADSLGLLAFPGFWTMAARYWQMGMGEMYRSLNKRAFTAALQTLVPDVRVSNLKPGGAGVRAQALDRKGNLLDDFSILESYHALHVINAPSPAATASIAIGREIANRAMSAFHFDA